MCSYSVLCIGVGLPRVAQNLQLLVKSIETVLNVCWLVNILIDETIRLHLKIINLSAASVLLNMLEETLICSATNTSHFLFMQMSNLCFFQFFV